MKSNVFDIETKQPLAQEEAQPITANHVLDLAREENLKSCFVLGLDQDGQLFFFGTPSMPSDINFILDRVKSQLLAGQI